MISLNNLDCSAGRVGMAEANSTVSAADAFAAAVANTPSGAVGIQCENQGDVAGPIFYCFIIWRMSA